ncbi:protein kinase domain-containing protein [Edaphobacter modestus]|uniref:Serine/threonine protein kinase n=1 Tax=Edaphobacter modestus TaxID=388466 RepID=A0A4Q7YTV4_9BACT|nr:protein kinase [Edaphobacter modestus]RZU41272.1 serine/threonine protein kinase [Edaphobacter modestus]
MNAERWREIKSIFDAAADLQAQEQAAFVHSSAGEDRELEAEVLRLLRANASTDGFMEKPAADLHTYIEPVRDEPVLETGSIYARRFEILRFLSRGGMGEVYEAWDTELDEAVALKTIRLQIASNVEVIERFKQEVKQAREVSHPNICRVHELFSHSLEDGQLVWFLSMELLRGETVLEWIRTRGPLRPALALSVCRQMVDGLGAAHAAGLVHRDFKSSNVILIPGVTGKMRAVITDFGLSLKMLRAAGGLAEPGGIGTRGYMAPEQEENGEVGPLADQYSLGVVMCEMVTGSLPEWSTPKPQSEKETLKLPEKEFPARWEGVIRRCLQRESKDRYPAIENVAAALAPPGIFGTPRRIVAAVLLMGVMAGGGVLWLRARNKCRICEIVQLTPDTDESESPSLSRDGHVIVYSSDRSDTGNLDIFLQQLPGGRPSRLTSVSARDVSPSISPDGSAVAFRSERDGGGIYLKDVHAGKEVLLVPRGRNPLISPDGKSLVYWTGDPDPSVASGKAFLLPLRGGQPVQIAKSFQDSRLPVWSPDGQRIMFSGCEKADKALSGCSEWWITSRDGRRIVNTHVMRRLRSDGLIMSQPAEIFWGNSGLVFGCGPSGLQVNLWTIKLDPQTWTSVGAPRQLLKENARDLNPSIANNGAIAFTRKSGALHIWRIDRAPHPGEVTLSKITEDAQIDSSPFVSEGGRWLVFTRGRGSRRSIWIRDNLEVSESLLVNPGMPTRSPIVDKTGQLLAYEQTDLTNEVTSINIRVGEGPVRRLCRGCGAPTAWFDTDRAFFYREGMPSVIKMADPRTGHSWVVLQEDGADLSDSSWSPANEMMLFTETKGDRKQIFAVHLPRSTAKVEGKWIPIPDTGVSPEHPRWSGDGHTIFYFSNKDGFSCIYGQAFSPEIAESAGTSFAVAHFHNQRASIDNVLTTARNLSVDGDSIYFNLGEQSSTIWLGSLVNR